MEGWTLQPVHVRHVTDSRAEWTAALFRCHLTFSEGVSVMCSWRTMLLSGLSVCWTDVARSQSASTASSTASGATSGALSASARTVPMRDVSLRAMIDAERRQVRAVVSTGIGTPLGVIPIRSAIDVRIDCRGEFAGTIAFHPFVRFLARLKGIALATNVEGRLLPACDTACLVLTSDSVTARARVERTEVTGVARRAGDSVRVHGAAWMVTDTAYHGRVILMHPSGSRELHITVFERGRVRKTPPA